MLAAGLIAVGSATAQTVPPDVAARITALNRQADELTRQTRYADAMAPATEVLALREKALGLDHPDVAWALIRLAELQRILGRYADAETSLRRSLSIREARLGPDHVDVSNSLILLAQIDLLRGRYAEGLPLVQRSLAIREAKLGRDAAPTGASLNVTGLILRAQGRNAEAEPMFRRALAIYETHRGPEDVELGHVLANLGSVYTSVGRYADAEAHFKRAVAIQEKALGHDHPDLANTLSSLGRMLTQRGRYKDAEPILQRSLAIREKTFGPDHPAVASAVAELAEVYRYEKRYAEAEPLHRRALAIREKTLGPDHPLLIGSYNDLALVDASLERRDDAEANYKRAIAIGEATVGPDAFGVLNARANLSRLYAGSKRYEPALEQIRLATEGTVRYREAEAQQRGAGVESERGRYKAFFFRQIWLTQRTAEQKPDQRTALIAEGFEAAQLVHSSNTAQAIAGMAARFAAGKDGLAGVVRERQDLADRWRRLDGIIVDGASKPPAERDVARDKAAREEQANIGKNLATLDAKIAQEFPQYGELISPRPVKLADLQAMLAPDEAMLVYLSGATTTWLWAVKRDRASVYELPVAAKALSKEIGALRGRLDPARNPELKAFDVKRAYKLHQSVLAPATADLDGVRHVFLVPDGALQSLPIGVLVTAPPPDKLDYRKTAWLVRQFAITTLPSVSSLRALRLFARGPSAPLPFLGIGDPALGGAAGDTRGVHAVALLRGALADVDEIRKLPPLPETADELRALAEAEGVGTDVLYLRDRASEATLKTLKLDQYRVIAFATHGLVADELQDLTEPALVLSPPGKASRDNDGLLTASEIAQLKLNADWVILSACNTASGDGTPGADRLSGLAKAFFYAGSRALLVSHWPVASQAAVRLTTGALDALKHDPKIGRAEALRRSELALLDDTSVKFAHPMLWAPFVVVGEGGAPR